jgi:urease accessory protein
MLIVDATYHEDALPESSRGYVRDTVTLGWEDRTHAYGRRISDGGIEFGASLPRGTVLRAGDCFLLDDARVVVRVIERPEAVFVIEPRTPHEWGLFAYHIGNRHQPLMIVAEGLVCPDVPGVEQLLQQHHMPFVRASRPFTPATTVAGHQH